MSRDLFPIVEDGKLAYIKKDGSLVLETSFEEGGAFREGLAYFGLHGKLGFMDTSGNSVIPPQFDLPGSFNEGFSVAGVKEIADKPTWKVGVIDRSGMYVIGPEYEAVTPCSHGIVGLHKKIIGETQYVRLSDLHVVCISESPTTNRFSEGLLSISDRETGRWGFRDTSGNWVVKPRYTLTGTFSEGLASADLYKKGKELTGFIDRFGNEVIPFKFSCFRSRFSEGLATFFIEDRRRGDVAGAIDSKGDVVIEPRFESLGDFREGMATYQAFGKDGFGYVNKVGKEVIPARFDVARDFWGGLAWVREWDSNGFSGYINTDGEWVWKVLSSKLKSWPRIGIE
jgi:hypothetical protein